MYQKPRSLHTVEAGPAMELPPVIFYLPGASSSVTFISTGDHQPTRAEIQAARARERQAHKAHKQMISALLSNDASRIAEAWPALHRLEPLHFLSTQCAKQYSDLITRREPHSFSLSSATPTAVDRLAALAAAKAFNTGFWACMRRYWDAGNPDAVLSLFDHLDPLLQQRVDLLRKMPSTPGTVSSYYECTGWPKPLPHLTLAYALMAHASKGSFPAAMKTLVGKMANLSSFSDIASSMQLITGTPSLHKKAREYARRIFDASVFILPLSTFRGRVEIGGQRISRSLRHFAENSIAECLREDACIVVEGTKSSNPEPDRHQVVVDDQRWAILLRALIVNRQPAAAERLWDRLHQLLSPMPMCLWAARIDGYAQTKSFDQAEEAWEKLRATRRPSAAVYSVYVRALFSQGRVRDALAHFHSLRDRIGTEPYLVDDPDILDVHDVVLEQLLRLSRVDEARKLLDDMKAHGPHPRTTSFSAFLKHHADGNDLGGVLATHDEMHAYGLVLDTYAASILLTAQFGAVHSDAVPLVLALVQQDGIVLSQRFIHRLLAHFVGSGNRSSLYAAIALVDHLDNSPSKPLVADRNYIQILRGIESVPWEDTACAEQLRNTVLDKALASGRKLMSHSHSVAMLVTACIANPQPSGPKQAWAYYKAYRDAPDRLIVDKNVHIRLLAGLRKRDECTLAKKVVADIHAANASGARPPQYSSLAREIEYVKKRVPWDKSDEMEMQMAA
ncbi:hypothetical protein PsYK624_013490 [Phanerochaete sordida]|uniref:Pentacotripeptide-repeat region of PRORP domain-containing protein n=1 Tax=Phanerochaete sordida TaxID=48140 RepID=A0A9P3L7R8_9APHY|nr:hypothetical protein PsYK624_013490 [Phanerochaete sordida]